MARIHAFEFNDHPSCPRFVRDSIVETLGTGLRWGRFYDPVGPVFAEFCRRAGADSILDLCTGTGMPVSILLDVLARQGGPAPRFALSDLFPNLPALEKVATHHPGRLEIVAVPVDATDVPAAVDRPARTVFNAFHHFAPDLAGRILADCVRKRRAIFVLESFTHELRRLRSILPVMTAAIFANPFLTRRDRLLKLLLTLPVPVIPLAGLWDAVVSILRTHTEEELRALVAPLGNGFAWEYRRIPFGWGGCATVFFGVPA